MNRGVWLSNIGERSEETCVQGNGRKRLAASRTATCYLPNCSLAACGSAMSRSSSKSGAWPRFLLRVEIEEVSLDGPGRGRPMTSYRVTGTQVLLEFPCDRLDCCFDRIGPKRGHECCSDVWVAVYTAF